MKNPREIPIFGVATGHLSTMYAYTQIRKQGPATGLADSERVLCQCGLVVIVQCHYSKWQRLCSTAGGGLPRAPSGGGELSC